MNPSQPSGSALESLHAYALLELIDDYLRLGWLPHWETLAGTVHGQYSMHCEWRCCCGRRVVRPTMTAHAIEVKK